MEKLENLELLTKEELISAVEKLQVNLSALEKENKELRELAEIGKKYIEHLKTEAVKLIKLVDGEKSPLLKLTERADVEILQELIKEYTEKAKQAYRPSSKQAIETLQEKPIEKK